MIVQSDDDLQKLKACGAIVRATIDHMVSAAEPGMTTREMDDLGRAYLEREGARSAPELVYKFPGATCISVNPCVAHGIPGDYPLQPGDLVNVDVSAEKDGVFTDAGMSFVIPPSRPDLDTLLTATKRARDKAIRRVAPEKPLNIIGRTIEEEARKHKFSVIENLASHGVGHSIHEEPTTISSIFNKADRRRLKEGQVITIEPFLSTGATFADDVIGDDWALVTDKGFYTAQFEHTLVVTKRGAIIVT